MFSFIWTICYLSVLVGLSAYGVHRYFIIYLFLKNRKRAPVPAGRFEQLPVVTVQLPIFNEVYVVERLLRSVSKLDYPRDRLQSGRLGARFGYRARRIRMYSRCRFCSATAFAAQDSRFLYRPQSGDDSNALGPFESRLFLAHPGAGDVSRRPSRARANRALSQRSLFQLQRNGRTLAKIVH